MALATPPVKGARKSKGRPTDQPFRWTRAALHRAVKTGFFDEDDRLELIEGELYPKMPQTPEHAHAIRAAAHHLAEAFNGGYIVQQQLPIGIGRISEPEPDISLVRGNYRDYRGRHSESTDVALIVEVSESSERKDRVIKAKAYAESGIPEYWVLLVNERRLEQFRDPGTLPDGATGYRRIYTLNEKDTVSPSEKPQASIQIEDLLPPPPSPE